MNMQYSRIIDISWPISADSTEYKDRTTIHFQPTTDFDAHNVRNTTIQLNAHTGTHIDAPSHFLKDGASVEHISLQHIIGHCTVIDLTHVQNGITAQDLLDHSIHKDNIILLKTRNSEWAFNAPFNPHFIYLTESGAQYLKNKQIKAVAIDYLGIERNQPAHQTHTLLMNSNIIIIEGLRLLSVTAGSYFFICLPLNIIGLEASPARAILMK